mgnify:CR=1 FL=1
MVPYDSGWNPFFRRSVHHSENVFQMTRRILNRQRSIKILSLDIDDQKGTRHDWLSDELGVDAWSVAN